MGFLSVFCAGASAWRSSRRAQREPGPIWQLTPREKWVPDSRFAASGMTAVRGLRPAIASRHSIRYLLAMTHDKILIVDFGSQVTQLIARRVREEGVYCEIVPFNKAAEAFVTMKPRGVILPGGPASLTDDISPRAPQAISQAGVPVLGISYAQQAMPS